MKCKMCGFINEDNIKFCVNCGSNITSTSVDKKSSNLSGVSNNKLYFGKDRHKINRHSIHVKTPNLKPLWIIGGIIIGSILIVILFDLIFHQYSNIKEFLIENKSSNLAIEAKVTSIASKFICSCQTEDCAGSSLETCACGTAIKERQFIRDKLEQNKKSNYIVVALANKYGFLKSEFKSKYDADPNKVWN